MNFNKYTLILNLFYDIFGFYFGLDFDFHQIWMLGTNEICTMPYNLIQSNECND